ncbi:ABC transporter ATP-binding protein [Streptomyces sp. TRM66268-LWL]|uniref:ABC transporter ATP-binding protein n=1 Tax=Streptomyces polyasparticus TaxID=2767826 RepID=A0ABR7SD36_9ACTN|nr:ATP-binding cassette domain-containing protein [Streptomyces polyasparticus]MBC9713089.1 ABC transporter ATP-binding protein [Streptomyces polyasparticus]
MPRTFHQVGRRYGLRGPWVLHAVGLALSAGTLVRVGGVNGSGKSTLLRLAAGIDTPSAGRIEGRPRTAYVPERFPPALPFTAYGYLTHLGRIHGLSRRTARLRAEHWLDRFGAGAYGDMPLSELSKGTAQKIAVAQALLAEPELLVLDEAWTGLDAEARDALDDAVTERVAGGATVLFVDHDPGRLAGAVTAAYEVSGTSLVPVAQSAPRVRIDAQAPPGTKLPDALPPEATHETDPSGTVRFSVPAAHSDALLRALLTAAGTWHIHRVHPLAARER